MNVEEAFGKLVSGEIESFGVQDAGSWRVRVDGETLASVAQRVMGKPKTEEVEVKQVAIVRLSDGIVAATYDEFPEDGIIQYGPEYVRVATTGHYTRPIPKKIKKRVEFFMNDAERADIYYRNGLSGRFNGPVRFFAEYEEEA